MGYMYGRLQMTMYIMTCIVLFTSDQTLVSVSYTVLLVIKKFYLQEQFELFKKIFAPSK